MIRAFHSAKLGMEACLSRLGVQGENISNSDTVGYRPRSASFSDTLYSASVQADGGTLAFGNGVRPAGTVSSAAQGAPENTGRALDAMIEGDGYFCILDRDGSLSYTRGGNFYASGDGWLVTAQGGYVLDGDLQRIPIEQEEAVKFGAAGQSGRTQIGVFTFLNPSGLEGKGGGLLGAGAASGAPALSLDASIRQGYLERSSVDIAEEMTEMIKAQRGFQVNARMIRAADEIEETANRLRG